MILVILDDQNTKDPSYQNETNRTYIFQVHFLRPQVYRSHIGTRQIYLTPVNSIVVNCHK